MKNVRVFITMIIGLIVLMVGLYLIHIYDLGETALEICWGLFLLLLVSLYTKNEDKAREIVILESKEKLLEEKLRTRKRLRKKEKAWKIKIFGRT